MDNDLEEKMEMDIHKKHESDLTRKEKWQLEKEKMAKMNRKEKLAYIWEYYKPEIFGVIAIIWAIWAGFSWYENSKYETIMYAVALDGYMSGEDEQKMEDEFREFIDDTEKYHKIVIDTSMSLNSSDNQLSMQANIKMQTIIAAGEVDVVIGTEEQVEQLIAQKIALNLNDVLSEEMLAEYGDKIVDGVKLDVTGNQKVAERMLVNNEPTYLILVNNGKNEEYEVQFVDYLME